MRSISSLIVVAIVAAPAPGRNSGSVSRNNTLVATNFFPKLCGTENQLARSQGRVDVPVAAKGELGVMRAKAGLIPVIAASLIAFVGGSLWIIPRARRRRTPKKLVHRRHRHPRIASRHRPERRRRAAIGIIARTRPHKPNAGICGPKATPRKSRPRRTNTQRTSPRRHPQQRPQKALPSRRGQKPGNLGRRRRRGPPRVASGRRAARRAAPKVAIRPATDQRRGLTHRRRPAAEM